jgi:hypothetical protein
MDIVLIEFAEPNKSWIYRCLKIKFIQRLYYSGKFQIFYPKAAVMDTLGLYAPLRIHPSVMWQSHVCNMAFVG